MLRFGKRLTRSVVLALVAVILLVMPVLAAVYTANVLIQETAGTDYTMLGIRTPANVAWWATNGYIDADGRDTRVLRGSTELPHMLQEDNVFFAAEVLGSSTVTYQVATGETAQDMSIVPGYNGYVTIADDAVLEPVQDFVFDLKGHINTDVGVSKHLVYKPDAFRLYVSAAENVRATFMDFGAAFPTVVATNGGNDVVNQVNHTVNLPAGIIAGNLLLVFFATDEFTAITFPNEGTDWIQLFETVKPNVVVLGAWYRIADGTEGATITVTTGNAQMTAHTSYCITGYSGVPEVPAAAIGAGNPDPPNLAPSWGAESTLWFAVCGHNNGTTVVNAYPANYLNGRNDRSIDVEGVGVGSARRELNAANENPGVFTLSVGEEWVANTVAIAPAFVDSAQQVTVTGVTSDIRRVVVEGDPAGAGTMTLSVYDDDGVHVGNSPQTVGLAGVVFPLNAYNWVLMGNSTTDFTQYWEYYRHTVGGTLIVHYAPNDIISGTTLPDREGAAQNGVFTFGTNPAGILVAMDSFVIVDQPIAAGLEIVTPDASDIVTAPPGLIMEDFEMLMTTNEFYFFINWLSGVSGIDEVMLWWYVSALVCLCGMAVVHRFLRNIWITGIAGAGLLWFIVSAGGLEWWVPVPVILATLFIGLWKRSAEV